MERLADAHDEAQAILDARVRQVWISRKPDPMSWVDGLGSPALRRIAARGAEASVRVDRELIDEALADVETDDELVAAEALAEKKLRSMDGLARDVQYRRLAGALARRGFSAGVTSTVLRRVLDTPSS